MPRLRVDLETWSAWTGASWDKLKSTVGRSFRMMEPDENIYTMAANAVMRLLRQYPIDPQRIGFLGLATESSTDNSAGAVIVRGMVDDALRATGGKPLARSVEVPELKHACLGGVYALKAALRFVDSDSRHRCAIVVAADAAEYPRGSTGEQTQGAGAVAMLVERQAKLLRVDLARAGSASAYRGPDFRKPLARHFSPEYPHRGRHPKDFPIFSGKYSTMAYVDAVVHAWDELAQCMAGPEQDYFARVRAWFFHRPYRFMPLQALSVLYVRSLARSPKYEAELRQLCDLGRVDVEAVLREGRDHPDLYASLLDRTTPEEPYPATMAVAKALRGQARFSEFVAERMSLGADAMAGLGNLYSGALPAWMAVGVEDALARGVELTDLPMVAIGYGSGDAAEAIPIAAVPGWQTAAGQIEAAQALSTAVDLTRHQYEALHDGALDVSGLFAPRREFSITKVGMRYEQDFQDLGVEYYGYVP